MTWVTVDILTRKAAQDYGHGLAGQDQHPLPTGLPSWDKLCDETGGRGLGDWWYVVIGGASNAGKTQLGLWLARQAAEAGLNPGLITMEVPRVGVQRRIYSHVTSFGYFDFLPHHWEQGDYIEKTERLAKEVKAYRGEVNERTLTVAEIAQAPTIGNIIEACDELVLGGCGAIIVDHLQLIKSSADQIADKATEISEALRWFAHGKRCLVIALSQLNRLASRERSTCPTMHDLLGGTSIESNANQVMMLDHSKQDRDEQHPHIMRTWVFLDKNREGPNRVRIPVEVNFKTGRWREAMPDEVRFWPGGDE